MLIVYTQFLVHLDFIDIGLLTVLTRDDPPKEPIRIYEPEEIYEIVDNFSKMLIFLFHRGPFTSTESLHSDPWSGCDHT